MTKEQAADDYIGTIDPNIERDEIWREFTESFKAGADWQKQQGWDWMKCEDIIPDATIQYDLGWNSTNVLVTNGIGLQKTHYVFRPDGSPVGWFGVSFIPTHWTPIILPK